jgi:flagellar protein FliO/FliZ
MTKFISLSRAAATAAAALCACVLVCALQGALASPASAFSPALKAGGENTPLNLSGAAGSAHTTSTGGASIVRTIVGLAIVIAVIWGLSWILRQVKTGREGGRDGGQPSAGLASVAALTLGSGRSVHLVRAGSDYVLLGATEHGVAPIHRYSEDEARDAGLLLEPAPVERSRLLSAAGQIFVPRERAGVSAAAGQRPEASPIAGHRPDPSPVAGYRPDPMQTRMYPPSSGLVGRLRELTVRR